MSDKNKNINPQDTSAPKVEGDASTTPEQVSTALAKELKLMKEQIAKLSEGLSKSEAENKTLIDAINQKKASDEAKVRKIQNELDDDFGNTSQKVQNVADANSEYVERLKQLEKQAYETKVQSNLVAIRQSGISDEQIAVAVEAFGNDAVVDGRLLKYFASVKTETPVEVPVEKPVSEGGATNPVNPEDKPKWTEEELKKKGEEEIAKVRKQARI